MSVLNPVDHPRNFGRLVQGLTPLGWEWHCWGQPAVGAHPPNPAVHFAPLSGFSRLSLRRLKVRQVYWRRLKALKPRLILVHTPELLSLALAAKARWGSRVVYDMHEDYAANIRHHQGYPAALRGWLANQVRQTELRTGPLLDLVALAEYGYASILPASVPQLVVPNLYQAPSPPTPGELATLAHQLPDTPARPLRIALTGNLAPEWGLFDLLPLVERFAQAGIPVEWVVAGFAPRASVWQDFLARLAAHPLAYQVRVLGGSRYLSFGAIAEVIRRSDAGLALYQDSPVFGGRIPTKFYTHLALKKPLIYSDLGHWRGFAQTHNLGTPLANLGSFSPQTFARTLANQTQAMANTPAETWDWAAFVPRWQAAVAGLL